MGAQSRERYSYITVSDFVVNYFSKAENLLSFGFDSVCIAGIQQYLKSRKTKQNSFGK